MNIHIPMWFILFVLGIGVVVLLLWIGIWLGQAIVIMAWRR